MDLCWSLTEVCLLHVIVMPTFFQALHRKTTQFNQKQTSDLAFFIV